MIFSTVIGIPITLVQCQIPMNIQMIQNIDQQKSNELLLLVLFTFSSSRCIFLRFQSFCFFLQNIITIYKPMGKIFIAQGRITTKGIV